MLKNNQIYTKHFILVAILLLLGVSLFGCASTGAYYTRANADHVPKLLSELEKKSGESYEDQMKLGWSYWFLKNDTKRAMLAWEKAGLMASDRSEHKMASAIWGFFYGNSNKSLSNLLDLIKTDPGGVYSELAIEWLEALFGEVPEYAALSQPVLEMLLDDPRMTMRSRYALTRLLAKVYLQNGEFEKQKQTLNRLGLITQFSVLGSFGSFGLLDFENNYGPEDQNPIQPEYKNRVGDKNAKTEIIKPMLFDVDKINFSSRNLYKNGGVFYTVSYIKLNSAKEVVFRLSTNVLSKLYVDSKELIFVNINNNYPKRFEEVCVYLEAGWHKVVVKQGSAYPSITHVLSVVGSDGMPVLDELSGDVKRFNDMVFDNPPKVMPMVETMQTYWEKQVKNDANMYNLFFAMLVYSENGNRNAFVKSSQIANEINPDFALLQLVESLSMSSDPALPPRYAEDQSLLKINKALELDPDLTFAEFLIVANHIGKDKSEEAHKILKKLTGKNPDNQLWLSSLLSLYISKDWKSEIEQTINKLLKLKVTNLNILETIYSYYDSISNFKKASEIAKQIDAVDGLGQTMSSWNESTMQYDLARDFYQQALSWRPYSNSYKYGLVNYNLRKQNYPEAIKLLEEMANEPGRRGAYMNDLLEAYWLNGEQDKAFEMLNKHLKDEPDSFYLRRKLAFYEGRKLHEQYASDGLKVIDEYLAGDWQPDSGAVIVLDEYIVELYPDGSTVGRVHFITQVKNKDALSKFGEISLPGNSEQYHVRIIKPDGRILVPEKIGQKRSVTLPNLEIGDFVEQDYVTGRKADTRMKNSALTRGTFYFVNATRPTYNSRFIVIRPASLNLSILPMNYTLSKAHEQVQGNLLVRTYENKRIDPIVYEPFMPPTEETTPLVEYSLSVKWDDIRNYLSQVLVGTQIITPELTKFLADNVKKSWSEKETVENLFYLLTDIIDGENQDFNFSKDANQVLLEKDGNRLLLLSTLLDMLKIKNDILLVKAKNIKDLSRPYADFKLYDDPLLMVTLSNDEKLFLTLSQKESVFNAPSPMLSASKAMIINGSNEVFINLPTWEDIGKSKTVNLDIKLAEDGSAKCEGIETISGYYSVNFKKKLKTLTKEQLTQMMEMILNHYFPGSSLEELKVENLNNPRKPLKLHYKFNIRQMAQIIGDQMRIPASFFSSNLLQSYIRLPERKYEMLINSINSGFNIFTISLPKAYKLVQSLENTTLKSDIGIYNLKVEKGANSIVYTREVMIPIQRISTKAYQDFAKFCASADQLERTDIILSK